MTDDARVPVTVEITSEDIVAANALDDALGFLTDNERPLVLIALARHRLAGVAAGREEAAKVADRIADESMLALDEPEARIRYEGIVAGARVSAAAIRQMGGE